MMAECGFSACTKEQIVAHSQMKIADRQNKYSILLLAIFKLLTDSKVVRWSDIKSRLAR